MVDESGSLRTAEYGTFSVGDKESGYALSVGDFRPDSSFRFVADSLGAHNEKSFSAQGSDRDEDDGQDCAEMLQAAGWKVVVAVVITFVVATVVCRCCYCCCS